MRFYGALRVVPTAPPAMALDRRTIADLEKDGFTHIDAHCASCGRIVQMPFRLLLTRQQITKATKITELGRRYRCQSCSGSFRPVAGAAWVDGPGQLLAGALCAQRDGSESQALTCRSRA